MSQQERLVFCGRRPVILSPQKKCTDPPTDSNWLCNRKKMHAKRNRRLHLDRVRVKRVEVHARRPLPNALGRQGVLLFPSVGGGALQVEGRGQGTQRGGRPPQVTIPENKQRFVTVLSLKRYMLHSAFLLFVFSFTKHKKKENVKFCC